MFVFLSHGILWLIVESFIYFWRSMFIFPLVFPSLACCLITVLSPIRIKIMYYFYYFRNVGEFLDTITIDTITRETRLCRISLLQLNKDLATNREFSYIANSRIYSGKKIINTIFDNQEITWQNDMSMPANQQASSSGEQTKVRYAEG